MDIVMWMLTGGVVGWAGYLFLGFNEKRGMTASIIIGTVGGFFGGNMIAPMFIAAAALSRWLEADLARGINAPAG